MAHFCMTCSVSQELQLFAEELQRYLSPAHLQHVAKEVGFVKRTSKYRAQDLAALCVWISQSVAQTSLTQLCSGLEATTGVLMSPEGLNQRFNTTAVEFLQDILTQLLTQKLSASRLCSPQLLEYLKNNYRLVSLFIVLQKNSSKNDYKIKRFVRKRKG